MTARYILNFILPGILLMIGVGVMPVFAEDDSLPATPINEIVCVYSPFLVQAPDGEFHCADEENIERLLERGFTLVDTSTPPEPIDVPSLTIERENNIIYLTWDNIHTTDNIYDILVIEEGVTSKVTSVEISTSGSGVAYYDTHTYYNKLTNADSIGVGGTVDGSPVDRIFMTVPPITPIVNIERLDDYSLKVIWENIPINTKFYFIYIQQANGSEFLTLGDGPSSHTFDSNASDPNSIALFNRINNAKQVGVTGVFGNIIGPITYVPVPSPTLTVERPSDNDITLSWTNMPTDTLGYNIHIIESDGTDTLLVTYKDRYRDFHMISEDSIIPDEVALFNRVNNAEQVGVSGFIDGVPGHVTYVPIPPSYSSSIPTPEPTPKPNTPVETPKTTLVLNKPPLDGFDGIKASCSDPTLNSKNGLSNSITVKSKPLKIPYADPPGNIIYSMGPYPTCILPSSISAQMPNKVQIGEIFNVTVTPSFELTQQQIDEYNINRSNVNDARTIWDNVCIYRDGYYRIAHPANYESSGDDISYSKNFIQKYKSSKHELHFNKLKGLNFDADSTTFQMTICKDPVYLASNSEDRENSDHLKIDSGYFYIASNHRTLGLTPLYIYTSIDGDSVILSEYESFWSHLSDSFAWVYSYFVQVMHILYAPIFHLHSFLIS